MRRQARASVDVLTETWALRLSVLPIAVSKIEQHLCQRTSRPWRKTFSSLLPGSMRIRS